MRWIAAVVLGVLVTGMVLALLGPVSIFEIVAVLTVSLLLAWYLVAHRQRR